MPTASFSAPVYFDILTFTNDGYEINLYLDWSQTEGFGDPYYYSGSINLIFMNEHYSHMDAHDPYLYLNASFYLDANTVYNGQYWVDDYEAWSAPTGTFSVAIYDTQITYRGNAHTDIVIGSDFNDRLFGLGGNDALHGGGGNDTLFGGIGADTLQGGDGIDSASYEFAASGVVVSLTEPSQNTGEAAGDVFDSIEGLIGSAHNDTLTGDEGDNTFAGRAGNDRILGHGGNDSLVGQEGDDTLIGGDGADTLHGGDGNDYVLYSDAVTGVVADLLNPSLNTGYAAGDVYVSIENLYGSQFDDVLGGNNIANIMAGAAGNDIIDGRGGNDRIYGGAGDDTLIGGLGADQLFGDAGFDFASYQTASDWVFASLASPSSNTGEAAGDTYSNIEGLIGSDFDDFLLGNTAANAIYGGAGDDRIYGGGGADTLYGGTGNDTMFGSAGADQFFGGDGRDVVDYSQATTGLRVDMLLPATNTQNAAGDTFSSIETIIGSNFADTLNGDAQHNQLIGGAGNDNLHGRSGNDTLDGGLGQDILNGGDGMDTFRFSAPLVAANVDRIDGFNAADDTILLVSQVFASLELGTLAASAFANSLTATTAEHRILYDKPTGRLFYDADGAGGAAAVHFATLSGAPTITASDFLVL
ncbi:calcium-binding protein [Xinfangfangia sp. D13-10-4-6]|uniref:calcium-binding protein n=1 Tax=Pseudogemmobacter hezensis TaxID=2737662 RepID=UPI00155786F5|nr:calcium-binding protein [Pseudogemmobacter hezensis]NPD15564.1 calcium-binding protein [Pseudogemmobacter hezensis]